jgi:hypothetical protein
MGRLPTQVSADPPAIKAAFRELESHPLLPSRYLAQIRVHVGYALRLAGLGEGSRCVADLSTEHQRLLATARPIYAQYRLSRFFKFCSLHAVAPRDIDQRTFEAFLADMELRSLTQNTIEIGTRTRRAWNYSARNVKGWPNVLFEVPKVKTNKANSRVRGNLPMSLVADLQAFRSHLVTDNTRRASPLTIGTINEVYKCLLRLLRLLSSIGMPIESCAQLAEPKLAALSLNLLWQKKRRRTTYVYAHACALCRLAAEWTSSNEEDQAKLADLRKVFSPLPDERTAVF